MTDVIVLATRNRGKVVEIQEILSNLPIQILGLEAFGDIPEPVENGLTFAQNACDKARYYAAATGRWCLADDSGLEVDALDGAPGVHSARYAADACPPGASRKEIDRANNAKLLRALEHVGDDDRTARFVCHLAVADASSVLVQAFDTVEGHIGHVERGNNGFGYDPLFYLPQQGCTTAQLDSVQKNRISHRGKAVRYVGNWLRSLASVKPGRPERT